MADPALTREELVRLRAALARALRGAGFGALAKHDAFQFPAFVSVVATVAIAAGFVVVIATEFDIESALALSVISALAILAVTYLRFPREPDRMWGIYLFLSAWLIAGAWQLVDNGWQEFIVSHVAPIGVGFVLASIRQ